MEKLTKSEIEKVFQEISPASEFNKVKIFNSIQIFTEWKFLPEGFSTEEIGAEKFDFWEGPDGELE